MNSSCLYGSIFMRFELKINHYRVIIQISLNFFGEFDPGSE